MTTRYRLRHTVHTRCGYPMPNAHEPCARAKGHTTEHRTRWAMDNAYRATTGREIDPYIYRDGMWVTR